MFACELDGEIRPSRSTVCMKPACLCSLDSSILTKSHVLFMVKFIHKRSSYSRFIKSHNLTDHYRNCMLLWYTLYTFLTEVKKLCKLLAHPWCNLICIPLLVSFHRFSKGLRSEVLPRLWSIFAWNYSLVDMNVHLGLLTCCKVKFFYNILTLPACFIPK